MNKRLLLALYDRSGLGAYMPVDYNGHTLEVAEHMEKFAELIVRECIAQCEKNVDHEYLGWGSKLSAFNIKQHFGVEDRKPCKSPYCECDVGKCSHPGFYDARGEE